ncbi:hypothetical protein Clacol_002729 [Clathrus columnatus]|uniref:RRM domain-containing protein n=1 Tax=Clathrus columnatus TaxID=1419009 RepID=A0AAV5A7G3_9AGAM|nr:hypothetical protein Clacol_002729 [Clathrus columnatus]
MSDSMEGVVEAVPVAASSAEAGKDVKASQESTPVPEVQAMETLYIQNLNEKIKIDIMKATLKALFKNYGDVLNVTAHRNLRMRGQAFVSFESKDIARKAQREVNRFPLYGKPMQISFAKTPSDAVVKVSNENEFEEHLKARKERKKQTRLNNPVRRKFAAKRSAGQADGTVTLPVSKRPAVQMPDEYLPPNKILFLQNLPENVSKDQLTALFSQYPNLYEVRLIPTKKDIAFVEYMDENSASVAKDALHNYKLDGEAKIKITFARK